jgi:dTDP-4-dehydrorhamnose 3,5-epimerase-like enzyme
MQEPVMFDGGVFPDDRGLVKCVNSCVFPNVKRFYLVENWEPGFIRAWHGHKIEAKYVTVVSGSAIIAAVKVSDWENPKQDNKEFRVHRHVLSAERPQILYIPAGYANGSMTLLPGTKIMYFSTTTWEESRGDDYRFPYQHWNPWEIEKR